MNTPPLVNATVPAGATAAAAFLIIVPFPERDTVSALPATLSLMVSVPFCMPPTVGLKVTLTVQLEPPARDPQDAARVSPKGAKVVPLT